MSDTLITRSREELIALQTDIETVVDMARAGKIVEAKAMLQEMLCIEASELVWTFTIMLANPELAAILNSQGKYPDYEEQLCRRLLEAAQEINGVDDPNNLRVMGALALSLYRQNKLDEAVKLRSCASDIYHNHFGFDSPEFLWAQNRLAVVLFRQGKYAEAEEIVRDVMFKASTRTDDNELISLAIINVATVLHKSGNLEHAELFYMDAIKRGLTDVAKPFVLSNMACLYEDRRHLNRAEAIYQEILELPDKAFVVKGLKTWIIEQLCKVQGMIGISMMDETIGRLYGKPNPPLNMSPSEQ